MSKRGGGCDVAAVQRESKDPTSHLQARGVVVGVVVGKVRNPTNELQGLVGVW